MSAYQRYNYNKTNLTRYEMYDQFYICCNVRNTSSNKPLKHYACESTRNLHRLRKVYSLNPSKSCI